jgi:hypothetical protein
MKRYQHVKHHRADRRPLIAAVVHKKLLARHHCTLGDDHHPNKPVVMGGGAGHRMQWGWDQNPRAQSAGKVHPDTSRIMDGRYPMFRRGEHLRESRGVTTPLVCARVDERDLNLPVALNGEAGHGAQKCS